MKILRLQRKEILNDCIHGILTVDGTRFSCYTLEAKCVEGEFPKNPTFAFALPTGEFKVRITNWEWYPLVPMIIHRPYINIGLKECPAKGPRAGDVCVGTDYINDRYLRGYPTVMEALENIIKQDFYDWRNNTKLVIENAPDCVHRDNASIEQYFMDFTNSYSNE